MGRELSCSGTVVMPSSTWDGAGKGREGAAGLAREAGESDESSCESGGRGVEAEEDSS